MSRLPLRRALVAPRREGRTASAIIPNLTLESCHVPRYSIASSLNPDAVSRHSYFELSRRILTGRIQVRRHPPDRIRGQRIELQHIGGTFEVLSHIPERRNKIGMRWRWKRTTSKGSDPRLPRAMRGTL